MAFWGALLALSAVGQPAINKSIGLSSAYDAGRAILPAPGGGFVIAGVTYPALGARPDAFLLRVDEDGNVLFHKTYGTPNAEEQFGKGLLRLNDGWLAVGRKANPQKVGWVVRFNDAGQIVWEKTYPSLFTEFHQVLALPRGGYLAIGAQFGDLLLAQFDANGSFTWQQVFSGVEEGLDAYLTAGGNACIVMGRGSVSKVHLGTRQVVWSKRVEFPNLPVGTPEVSRLVGIASVGKGLFALIGSTYRELPTSLYSAHYAAVWSERGDPIWDAYFRGSARDDYEEHEGFGITYLPNAQHVLFVGRVGNSISITRTSLNGQVIEQKEIAAPGVPYGAVLIRIEGRYAMTGAVFAGNMDTYFYHSAGNALQMQAPASTPEDILPAHPWELQREVSQNRAWIVASAQKEGAHEAVFQIWAVDGALARELRVWIAAGENRFPIDLTGLPSGLYWLSKAGDPSPPKALWIGER